MQQFQCREREREREGVWISEEQMIFDMATKEIITEIYVQWTWQPGPPTPETLQDWVDRTQLSNMSGPEPCVRLVHKPRKVEMGFITKLQAVYSAGILLHKL